MINKKLIVQDIELNIYIYETEPFPSDEELNKIIDNRKSKYEAPIKKMELRFNGDYVDVKCVFSPTPFVRIRRITGYLVGDLERFNNAKRAEVADRVPHSLSSADKMRLRDTDADGRSDLIDDSYTKPADKFIKLTPSEYDQVFKENKKLLNHCRQSDDGNFILQCSAQQKEDIEKILKHSTKKSVIHKI